MKQQQISGQSDAAIDCRQQQLQVIHQYTHEDFKGYASDRWPRQHHNKPTLFVLEDGITTLKLLEDLTDEQIQDAMADNPSGQGDELTPFILIRPLRD